MFTTTWLPTGRPVMPVRPAGGGERGGPRRWRAERPVRRSVRQEDRANAVVLLLLEDAVTLGRLLQRQHVRGEVLGHQLALGHPVEQHRDVALAVHLGTADG